MKKLPKQYHYITLLFFFTRVILTVAGVFARKHWGMLHNFVYSSHSWLTAWGAWDSGWYLPIAKYGYWAQASTYKETLGQADYAFFPLYPLLTHLAAKIFSDYFLAGITISFLAMLIGAIFFYKLAKIDFDEKASALAVVFLLCFPTGFMLSAMLSEGVFFLLAVLAFYFARQKRWWLSGLAGFLAALTRSVGGFLFIPLLYEYYDQNRNSAKKFKTDILACLLPGAGLLSYFIYLKKLTGDFFAYVHIQKAWSRNFGDPIRLIIQKTYHLDLHTWLALAFVLLSIAIIIASYKNIRKCYLLYAGLLILIPLSTGLDSMPRYLAVIFPLYLMLAQLTKNSKLAFWSLVALMVVAQIILFASWTTGRNWVV